MVRKHNLLKVVHHDNNDRLVYVGIFDGERWSLGIEDSDSKDVIYTSDHTFPDGLSLAQLNRIVVDDINLYDCDFNEEVLTTFMYKLKLHTL